MSGRWPIGGKDSASAIRGCRNSSLMSVSRPIGGKDSVSGRFVSAMGSALPRAARQQTTDTATIIAVTSASLY